MKIGVISDTHVSGRGLHPKKLMSQFINKVDESVAQLADLVRPHFQDVDLIIHAGDFVCYPVITALEEFAPVEGVAGNMDPHEISGKLPAKKVIDVAGVRIGIVHGYGAPDGLDKKLRREFDRVDCIVFGHTHHAMNQVVDGVRMINPGSPTDKRWAPSRSIGILRLGDGVDFEVIPLD